ncbi:MAG: sigma 54-interacting transcriptional regulator [Bdellovibrionales bacterium]
MQTMRLEHGEENRIKTGYFSFKENGIVKKFQVRGLCLVGRDVGCDYQIQDSSVSRRHLQFENRAGKFYVKDLDSQNGSFINGIRVVAAELNDGDQIQLGNTVVIFSDTDKVEDSIQLSSKNLQWNTTLKSLGRFAQTSYPVLLLGESGTGKEILARELHRLSERSQYPFVSINCSALNANLIESELFGHIKGSYTDAKNDRKGAFQEANGGTLVLDEIGDLPIELQAKLLRALENKEIRPLGSDRNIKIDVRIVASTHKDLHQLMQQGLFRQDLFYRLNVINVLIPPLRERSEDFESILFQFAREHRVRFSHNCIQEMKKFKWVGNIRELKNFVARASATYPMETVQPEHIQSLMDQYKPKENNLADRPSL